MPTHASAQPDPIALGLAVEAACQHLAGRSAEFEQARALPADVAQRLAELGLYRLLTPAVLGGHECPPGLYYTLIERLARADAAAAWCCFIGCTSSLLAAYLPEDAAKQLFADPALKLAGVFAPRGQARAELRDGVPGLRVSGRWAWGSGSAQADLLSAGCLLLDDDGQPQRLADGSPRVLSVLLRREQVRLLGNWSAFGLQGTGSGEFEAHEAFVPQTHSACLLEGPRLQTPLYRFPVFGLLALSIAAVASGVAREALAHFSQQAQVSVPQAGQRPLASRATVQEALARAHAQLESARAWQLATVAAAWEAAQADQQAAPGALAGTPPDASGAAPNGPGQPLPTDLRRDLRLASTHLVHTAAAVVDRVYALAGGGAVFASSPLQRALRDVHVATQHMMVGEPTWELCGRLLLAQPTQTTML